MDETGVLSNDPQQRFFALGLLKIAQTSLLYEDLKKLKDRYKINHGLNASVSTPKGKLVEYIEMKLEEAFSECNNCSGNYRHHKDLEGTFTIFEPFYFSVYSKR